MLVHFFKYHGTGNDFIIVDNRQSVINPNDHKLIHKLCDRRFGIGADGFMLISSHDKQDFEMSYFNRDGSPGSLCGNGARCIALFAKKHGITSGDNMEFLSFDGSHKAYIRNDLITIQMKDVTGITNTGEYFFLDTGSPHAVLFKNDVRSLNVCEEAQKIRYDRQYDPGGTNVNYVQIEEHSIFVRTYERGVEDETLIKRH